MTAESLFHLALAISDPQQRLAFLDEACAGQLELRAAVDALLVAHHPFASTKDLSATVPSAPETDGTIIAGRYKLLQKIGEGGMGSVWMAEQFIPVKRRVAVKLIRAERGDSRTILARFEAERQAIAIMDHPNIAKLYDAGTTEAGMPFFVMELVKGVALNEYCDSQKLNVTERLKLFSKICSAVQHAHQKGIIHRDLKPTNILVDHHDQKPEPKIIDFGLAKATTGMQLSEKTLFTGFGMVLGTPLYMAPEQASFNAIDVDTRADVYSLGVILYELLTGTTPLTRDTLKQVALDEMLKLIREQDPPTPSHRLSSSESSPSVAANRQTEPQKLGRFVRGELDWITLKALHKNREERYESASSLGRDIDCFLHHEPVMAGPPSTMYRLRKFIRRNKMQVTSACLVLLALIIGCLGTTWGWLEAIKQEEKAQHAALLEKQAKEEARRKQKEAEINLAYAKKGNEILGSIFTGLNPESIADSGRPLQDMIREQLHHAVKALDSAAIGDPLTMAKMQITLGRSLISLGEYPTALVLLTKAGQTMKAQLGEEHPDALDCQFHVASALLRMGEAAKSVRLLEQLNQQQKVKRGPDHPDTLDTVNSLAMSYQAASQLPKALMLFIENLDKTKKRFGPNDPITIERMSNLAGCYQALGQYELALPLFEQALAFRRVQLGPDHPFTVRSLNNLAGAYYESKQIDRAVPLFVQALDWRKRHLGPDHPLTLSCMNNLAMAYRELNQLPLALPLLEETLRLRKQKFGPNNPDTMRSMNNLAGAYRAAGKLEQALPLYEETYRMRKEHFGPNHVETLTSMNNLALGYRSAKRLDQAIPLMEETYRLAKEHLGAKHPLTNATLSNLVTAYQAQGQLEQALPYQEVLLQMQKERFGPDHPETLTSMSNLALLYADLNKHALAVPLLEVVVQNHKSMPMLSPAQACFDQFNLSRACLKSGQAEKAKTWAKVFLQSSPQAYPGGTMPLAQACGQLGLDFCAYEFWQDAEPLIRESMRMQNKLQPDHWTTFNIQAVLGWVLLSQKRYDEAEPLLLQGYDGMKQRDASIPPRGKIRLSEALQWLVQLYEATGKKDEAAKWRKELEALKAKSPSN